MYTNFVMKFEEYFMINMGIRIYEYIKCNSAKKVCFPVNKNVNLYLQELITQINIQSVITLHVMIQKKRIKYKVYEL